MSDSQVQSAPPAVSVLMPVYNAQRYLAQAIESILNQTFTDFELLILNDGSTDGSEKILRDYAAKDSRIRVSTRANRGLVCTLNELIEFARGQYFARMDADDVALPQRFAIEVEYLNRHPECVLVGSAVQLIDPDGEPITVWRNATDHESIDNQHLREWVGGVIYHPSAMIRADAMRAVGGYRQQYELAEDLDLWLRLAEIGRLANLPDVLLQYRQHPSSNCARNYARQHELANGIVKETYLRRGLDLSQLKAPPARENVSPWQQRHNWAWWALRSGNLRTARKHALRNLLAAPARMGSWKTMYCAWRGR